ncbi:zinc-binding dehydrogenase [Gordonia alkanivorans]|uniref:zinc-binding dehydrogenase n=1 Tax=Gordonia alkanivorans TaxID=84096 RepID=UPI00244894B7|nr:zinc-binding dehydrogenase [Gordonia alkanivorans]MDH3047129.1 zinc-binding dehydrogenase [Gordonia alkanivorans]
MRNVRAVFTGGSDPIQFQDAEVTSPPPGGMNVRVVLAGVCGTDAHRLRGDLPVSQPVGFGHEGVGLVEELGPGTHTDSAGQPLVPGDRVYWFPPAGCGECHQCNVQQDIGTCDNFQWPPSAAEPNPAAFQEFATLKPNVAVYRVPDETPFEAVIAFGCAMQTALGAFRRLGRIAPGSTVVVQGTGPVGLATTLLAGLSPAARVIAIGAGGRRMEAARRLGATDVLSIEALSAEERRSVITDATSGRGADVVLESAGVLNAFDEGMEMLAKNGTYVVQGLYSGQGTVSLNPFRLNNYAQRIIGSVGGNPEDIHGTVVLASRFHESMGFGDLVTHRFPLHDLRGAIESMRDGGVIKPVVQIAAPD